MKNKLVSSRFFLKMIGSRAYLKMAAQEYVLRVEHSPQRRRRWPHWPIRSPIKIEVRKSCQYV